MAFREGNLLIIHFNILGLCQALPIVSVCTGNIDTFLLSQKNINE